MATINIGSIKFKWQGAYAGGTAYTVDDVVSYLGSSYICIAASTGNLPTNATYWEQMSSAGTDGTDFGTILTTQGDIVYRDASGIVRLGAGTSGQVLQTGGTGANPSWVDASSGKVLGTGVLHNSTARTTWGTQSNVHVNTGNLSDFYYINDANCYMEGSYTKQSSTSNLFVWGHASYKSTNTHDAALYIVGDEANGKILHLDEHNGVRQYLSASFNTILTGIGTGSKTIRFALGMGDSRSNSGIRGIVGNDVGQTDISQNNGMTFLAVMEVEV